MKYDFKKIGKFLEKKRNEMGLSLENLAMSGGLSVTTLCRLEKGKVPKKIDKAIKGYQKYCALLGLNLDEVDQIVAMSDPAELKTRLMLIESSIDLKQSLEEDIERLEQLEIFAPESPYIVFLKAKALFYSKQWEKAKAEALKVIDLTEEKNEENLRGAAYNILANYYYQKNDLSSAIEELEKGIEAFDGEERLDIYYALLSSKVIFLEQSGHLEDGQEELEELGENIHRISNTHVACLVYEYQAKVLLKHKKYEKALNKVLLGLKLASREQKFDQAFELWEVLGRIYEAKQDFESAERAYFKALKLEEKVTIPSLLITIYNRLGRLSMKQKKFNQAASYLEKALSYQESYSGPRLIEAIASQAELFIAQGKRDQAISTLKKGLELAEKLDVPAQAQKLVSLILDCMEETDENYFDYLKRFYQLSKV